MKSIPLTKEDQTRLQSFMFESGQLVPFYATNSVAKKRLATALRQSESVEQVCGLFSKKQLVAVFSYQLTDSTFTLTNLLVKDATGTIGFQTWLAFIWREAKRCGAKKVCFALEPLNLAVKNQLLKQDYQLQEKATSWLFSKEVTYRTALVLGGGGARGAYQIGAWRALVEMGISFDLICGTSVGALNGGLILQGDLAIAEQMWAEIDTGKILAFPLNTEENQDYSVNSMLKDIQSFASSAISSLGVSTEPLRQLISDLLDESRMLANPLELYVCTTQIPRMKEVVIDIKQIDKTAIPAWLLASSSFFPAMQATKINDVYYADGGYRNNVPIDVALAKGASELIVIDVKGPGITKPTKIPAHIPCITLSSPWSLGTVLLFDGKRSSWNAALGYLETYKAFGKYSGYYYTFASDVQDDWWNEQWVAFVVAFFEENGQQVTRNQFMKVLKNSHKGWFAQATNRPILEASLELVAKLVDVSPGELYTLASLLAVVQKTVTSDFITKDPSEKMLLSLTEWMKIYANRLPLPTEKQQVNYLWQLMQKPTPEGGKLLRLVSQQEPTVFIETLTLYWLTTIGKEQQNGTSI